MMKNLRRLHRAVGRGAALLAAGVLIAACAAANKTVTVGGSSGSGGADSSTSASPSMPGMNMGATATVAAVNGIKPIPSQLLASTEWQGMKIQARTMTAVPFVVFNGTKERMVQPPTNTSFHLMVMLNDAHTSEPIPYASVWATFSKGGKVVYDEQQWPMLSAFMGPHYGNNVQLPGAGSYKLSLLISPPVSARHLEYKDVWLKPHRVTVSFNWKPGE
jgi:hypothetical protein